MSGLQEIILVARLVAITIVRVELEQLAPRYYYRHYLRRGLALPTPQAQVKGDEPSTLRGPEARLRESYPYYLILSNYLTIEQLTLQLTHPRRYPILVSNYRLRRIVDNIPKAQAQGPVQDLTVGRRRSLRYRGLLYRPRRASAYYYLELGRLVLVECQQLLALVNRSSSSNVVVS